jgi:hypothetical protein
MARQGTYGIGAGASGGTVFGMGMQDGQQAVSGLARDAADEAARNEKNKQIERERRAGNAQLGSTVGGLAGGAIAGSAAGPWGAAIGALIGGVAGGLF